MKRDLKSSVDTIPTLSPALRAANGTGTAVDVGGYDSAFVVFSSGDWTDGTWTPKIQESDTTTAGSFTDVGTADLQGAFTAVSGTAGEYTEQRVGYIGSKRYIRGFITGTGTTGHNNAMSVVRGHPARQPLS